MTSLALHLLLLLAGGQRAGGQRTGSERPQTSKPKIDPAIAQPWTIVEGEEFSSGKLSLNPNGTFTMRVRPTLAKVDSIFTGIYTVAPVLPTVGRDHPEIKSQIVLQYDIATLRRVPTLRDNVPALLREGKKYAPGLILYRVPAVPFLTDGKANFVPVQGEAAARQRLKSFRG